MSRLAPLLMFLAWLLYGAMPAMASQPVAMPTFDHTAAAQQHSGHGNHLAKAKADATEHHENSQKPCPHGAKNCVMPFCAACVTLLPEPLQAGGKHFTFSYPAPEPVQALISAGPAPIDPPPRS
ncbi:hypothetical protein [Rhizobium sp. LCM 4573]|uniref:hypothetical protein n=1 Tax=Rhizobium sp. LCM 4573 TaxID=1848291 RepID=UPI0008D9DBE9|nr:hypothetical protein [Rhizobium sp. LCM 4573]OHV75829.1 hypothetical protein LCM4573_14245 [Rhizobium sp. LCM 4573]